MKRLLAFLLLPALTVLSPSSYAQQHWKAFTNVPDPLKTSLAGLNDSILVTGTGYGIWRSGNFGADWKHTLKSSVIYSIYTSKSGKILAGGKGKVFYSHDKGVTWDSTSVDTEYPVKQFIETAQGEFLLITGTDIVYALGYVGDGVFFNTGDLTNWEKRNTGLPPSITYCGSIAIDHGDRIYLGTGDSETSGIGGLFISDDKGLHWEHIALDIEGLGSTRIENLLSISITPDDSVIVTSHGAVLNFGYSLNVIKHRNDVANPSTWRPLHVWNTNIWWMDQELNRIHFSKNGNWYSSVLGSRQQGGSYISSDKGKSWTASNASLNVSVNDRYQPQFFYETSEGLIVIAQSLDKQIYLNTGPVPNYAVAGNIKDEKGNAVSGVTLNGPGSSTLTDANGDFILRLPKNSTGSLSFYKAEYIFSPGEIILYQLNRDTTGISIKAKYTGNYTVKGSVKNHAGIPIADVSIEGLLSPVKTDSEGGFLVELPAGWSGNIVPVAEHYQFIPATWQIQDLNEDDLFQEFEALAITKVPDDNALHADVYPNPSLNRSFFFSIKEPADVLLLVHTVNGVLVHQRSIRSAGNLTDTWEAPCAGIYVLTFRTRSANLHYRIVSY